MIIYHHNDMDGRCAAAIVKRKCPQTQGANRLQYREVDYKSAIVAETIEPGEVVYIVDFSFKPEVMAEVLARTGKVFWIDHHISAKQYDYGRELAGLRDFSEPNRKSGARLAWDFFSDDDEDVPFAVELVSDYDTWTMRHAEKTVAFMEGLKLIDHGPENDIWDVLLGDDYCSEQTLSRQIERGRVAIEYRNRLCGELRQSFGYECEFEGLTNCYALNAYRFGSLAFGDEMQKRDCCIAYIDDGLQTTVSLYTEKMDIDLSELARKHGGGGHRKAAGFVLEAGQTRPWEKFART
jgi:oligoribonuclease NrnB/cAMP/cGMP phosphodiesterase (DHH superfamily)